MNKLLAIEVFVQVVDAGGFTRAAELMQLPKATVSTMVAALETSLSVKLLHRTTRNVTVTAEGAAYYERCLHILSYVRDADDSLLSDRITPHGRLRVDVPTGVANSLIIPALPDFFKRYPDIALELGCGDRPVDLVEEGVDCAIRGGVLPNSNLAARAVGVMNFVTCAAPSYLAEHGMPQHPRDLAQHRCISFFSAKTGKVREWDFARGSETFVVGQPSSMAINDANGYLCAGLSGLGIMQAGAYEALRHIDAGRLVPVLPDWTTAALPISVVYPQNRHLAAKVRVFIEWTAALFANSPRFQARQARAAGPR